MIVLSQNLHIDSWLVIVWISEQMNELMLDVTLNPKTKKL